MEILLRLATTVDVKEAIWIGFVQGWLRSADGRSALKLRDTDIQGLIGFVETQHDNILAQPLHVTKACGTPSPQPKKPENSKRQGRRKTANVSWYGKLLIIGTLMVAAGWEIFQLILTIITPD
ncbi:hypothetical protein ASC80_00900 [Afipia sp. Root123D2]|uniref:hypothetical protein n=1 Tax=Afipia sp. Root123D2 TaxID=1736436 RepID=UPI0006F4DE54|nr:hypothetical protein [Afipia sp. Root123D2]KQW21996.1 hypothetical protein ASC80_00900 [Afipia sp. Root123D2]